MLQLPAHHSMLPVGLADGQVFAQDGIRKLVDPVLQPLSGIFHGWRVVCGLGNPRRSPDGIGRSLRCGKDCEVSGLSAIWAGGLVDALADIFKLLEMQSSAGFCGGIPVRGIRAGCWQRYNNFESCNVNNLQSCLVWICLSGGGKLGSPQ
jgi:hypothetical protein